MNTRKFIPEVKFDSAPIDLEAELLYAFSDPNGRFSNRMHKVYPELQEIRNTPKDKSAVMADCKAFAEKIIERDGTEISKVRELIQDDWKLVGADFLEAVSEHFETDWTWDKKVITGYISINPICPRFLDKYSFFINYRNTVRRSRETIAHEILHFLWFKKWKEVFPESESTEYESPHLVWRLSEVMAPIILQCNPKIEKLIQPTNWGYDSFKDLKIGDVGMSEYFAQLYMENVKQGKKFDEILQILWTEAQNHQEILSRF